MDRDRPKRELGDWEPWGGEVRPGNSWPITWQPFVTTGFAKALSLARTFEASPSSIASRERAPTEIVS